MPTEAGIEMFRMRRNKVCASHNSHPIPSSVRSAATFSHWEKDDAGLLQPKKKKHPLLPVGGAVSGC